MLDSDSEITLVDASLVSSLRLSGHPHRLVLSTVNSQELREGERFDIVVESLIDEQPQRLQLKEVDRDKDLHEKYSSAISSYVTKGHARKPTKEKAERRSNKTWYVPHHPVISPNKAGKIGVVFDAAPKFHGTSLNDQLLQGPDYINNLAGVLMRFRQEEVVLVADREQMFHQVRVPVED